MTERIVDSMRTLALAVDHLGQGHWAQAHHIAQEDASDLGSWLHGIVHIAEGDLSNARYWYRQAGRPFPAAPSVERELAAFEAALAEER